LSQITAPPQLVNLEEGLRNGGRFGLISVNRGVGALKKFGINPMHLPQKMSKRRKTGARHNSRKSNPARQDGR
jgi:hypothetical protein